MNFSSLTGIVVYQKLLEQNKAEKVKQSILQYLDTSDVKVTGDQLNSVRTTYLDNSNFLKDANIPELEQYIISCCNEFLSNLGVSINYHIHSWLNVYDNSMSMQPHCHYNSLISGCYYVSMPDGDCGGFYIPEHIEQREQYRARYNMKSEGVLYNPVENTILLFEPWMKHGVHPNKTDKPRISVAFNAYIA
jgi:uncharacterized protein (TIGR02466 family)